MVYSLKALKKFMFMFQILFVIGIISLISVSCKSPESPDADTEESTVANIIIINDYGEALDIYLDGVFQFSLAHEDTGEIEDVSLEKHRILAKKVGINRVVDWRDIEITDTVDYTWIIDDPADINIANNSGISLKIYMDEIYQFDLADEENRWILDVEWGEHLLKALKLIDDAAYASTIIEITKNQDYSWTIE
jgi:hypothetical protein